MIAEASPQDTAYNLGFECSDEDLRKLVQFSMKVAKGSISISEAIIEIIKDYDVPVTDDTKKAAGAAFLFTYGLARAQAKAEIRRRWG